MKRKSISLLSGFVAVCAACPGLASAQIAGLNGYVTVIPLQPGPANGGIEPVTGGVTPIPQWTYSVTGYDGNSYTGKIVGLSPYNRGKTTTNIPTQIVPLPNVRAAALQMAGPLERSISPTPFIVLYSSVFPAVQKNIMMKSKKKVLISVLREVAISLRVCAATALRCAVAEDAGAVQSSRIEIVDSAEVCMSA